MFFEIKSAHTRGDDLVLVFWFVSRTLGLHNEVRLDSLLSTHKLVVRSAGYLALFRVITDPRDLKIVWVW